MARTARLCTTLVVSIAVAAAALTGCTPTTEPEGEPAPTASAPAPVQPVPAGTVDGDGYSFEAPEGWGFPDVGVPGYDDATFAADLSDTDGFADNVNIIASPAGEVTPAQVESLGAEELAGAGADDVTVGERRMVAGSEAANLSASVTQDDVEYLVEQYYLTDDGQTFVVTFSFSPDAADEQRAAAVDTVLDSWTWTAP